MNKKLLIVSMTVLIICIGLSGCTNLESTSENPEDDDNGFWDNSEKNAYFSDSKPNIWIQNYWDDWIGLNNLSQRWKPYRIEGKKYMPGQEAETIYSYDWFPARKTYDI
jgi:hypothetical protein